MKHWIVFVILAASLCGCGRNPVGPNLPPIVRAQTFEEQMSALDTPAKAAMWVKSFAQYDSKYNLHWGDTDPDQVYTLAKSMWDERWDGKNRGCCGQFAAFYVLAARTHGLRCGGIVYWNGVSGHARAWIELPDGSISMTDNDVYQPHVYRNYDELVSSWRKMMLDSAEQYGELLDEKFEIKEVLP